MKNIALAIMAEAMRRGSITVRDAIMFTGATSAGRRIRELQESGFLIGHKPEGQKWKIYVPVRKRK